MSYPPDNRAYKVAPNNLDPEAPHGTIAAKPRFMSVAWWRSLFSALNFSRYSARDWGIYNLSSLFSYGTIFGIFKPVSTFVTTHTPWVVSGIKAAVSAVAAGLVALVKLVVH